jgi:pimeloyl-ACP methyl ester carboxylesterase
LWGVFEAPPAGVDVRLVRAGRSAAWHAPAVAARVAALPPAAAARLLTLPDASHWLHVDKPEELIAMLLPALTAPRRA